MRKEKLLSVAAWLLVIVLALSALSAGRLTLRGLGTVMGGVGTLGIDLVRGGAYIAKVWEGLYWGRGPLYSIHWAPITDPNNLRGLLILNPPAPDQDPLNDLFNPLLRVSYVSLLLALVLLAFYLLFLSASPQQRAKAKLLFAKLLIAMVLVSLSPELATLMLDLSKSIAEKFLKLGEEKNLLEKFTKAGRDTLNNLFWLVLAITGAATPEGPEVGYYILVFILIIVWGTIIFPFVIRYFLVTIGLTLLPLSIILYFFAPTRGVGRFMLEQTIVWTFLQVINVLVVLASAAAIATFPPDYLRPIPWPLPSFIVIFGFCMLMLAPLFLIRFFRHFLP